MSVQGEGIYDRKTKRSGPARRLTSNQSRGLISQNLFGKLEQVHRDRLEPARSVQEYQRKILKTTGARLTKIRSSIPKPTTCCSASHYAERCPLLQATQLEEPATVSSHTNPVRIGQDCVVAQAARPPLYFSEHCTGWLLPHLPWTPAAIITLSLFPTLLEGSWVVTRRVTGNLNNSGL